LAHAIVTVEIIPKHPSDAAHWIIRLEHRSKNRSERPKPKGDAEDVGGCQNGDNHSTLNEQRN
jgi:hypothetical protein